MSEQRIVTCPACLLGFRVDADESADAARYRWIRECVFKDGDSLGYLVRGADDLAYGNMSEGFDMLVDEARSKAP
jgi:hypothetical protein